MEVKGKIIFIGNPVQVSDSFQKVDLVLETEEQYPQSILIEFHQDKVGLVMQQNIGSNVSVSINLRGRKWVNPQGETKFFNTIQGWKIQQSSQEQYTHNGYHGSGSAVNAFQNQQVPPKQGNYAPPQQFNGQQQAFNTNGDTDDLPF